MLGYVPAEAHHGEVSYIDYYVREPITGAKRRMRIKLNHVKSAAKRKAYARGLVAEINIKLARGWNPLTAAADARSWMSLDEVLDQFIASKVRDTNHSSPKTYISFVSVFRGWCRKEGLLPKVCSTFTRAHAMRFLDHLLEVRKVNPTTYNNYILRSSILFIWLMEREYRADNPFKGIRRQRRMEKLRTLITDEERTQCLAWFQEHDPPMVMVCLFVFHVLLRPRSELLRIRVQDLDLVNGTVNVSGHDSKSKRVRRPAIPDVMLPFILASNIMQAKPTDYVVGKDLLPGKEPCGHNTTGNRWHKMRKALRWPADKQLYSLRDTGIVQLITDDIDLQYVMRQADHRSIETTNRYVQHYFHKGAQQVRTKATGFSQ